MELVNLLKTATVTQVDGTELFLVHPRDKGGYYIALVESVDNETVTVTLCSDRVDNRISAVARVRKVIGG